jgi:hypothetical protein
VPRGALADGTTYWWHVWTYDGTAWHAPSWVWSFRVDLGLGERPSQPLDDLGPVTVNLASGNVVAHASSPSLPTVGGPVGLSYTYNSAAPSTTAGLTGSYYAKPTATDDPATHEIVATDVPAMVRPDPMVYFVWNGASPGPGLGTSNFSARWTGYVRVPTAGSYTFGAVSDDGVRILVGNPLTKVLERWVDQSAGAWGTPVTLPANTPVPIQIDYYQHLGGSELRLVYQGPDTAGFPGGYAFPPASWFSTAPAALPPGWSVSADLGGQLSYASARPTGGGVTVRDRTGATHFFAATPGGGYAPPPGEDGVLSRDGWGRLTLNGEDGIAYVFAADGGLAAATSAVDDRRPAAPLYTWEGTPARLTKITDPVGHRDIVLRYGGDPACPASPPPNLAVAPPGMLCSVTYWDGTQTKLWYTPAGGNQLARIQDPGDSLTPPITDFAYDGAGRLLQVRSPLVADALAAGVVTASDESAGTYRTLLTYDPGAGPPR